MVDTSFRVGVVSFTDPREANLVQARDAYLRERHASLVSFLRGAGLTPVDPMTELRAPDDPIFGVCSPAEVVRAARLLRESNADCLIIGCWHWTDPALPLSLVRELALPVLLYTEDDPAWAGAACLSAVGASLWEAVANSGAGSPAADPAAQTRQNLATLRHRRIMGDKSKIPAWARGVCALGNLRRSSLLAWGGSDRLSTDPPQDEVATLKALLIGDILDEAGHLLNRRAERIQAEHPERVTRFLDWLVQGGARINYDGMVLTPEILRSQVALYLAARDRLRELTGEPIIGVSVDCQPEPSIAMEKARHAVSETSLCLLPSFLGFGFDGEGPQPVVPAVCGGDIKGLVTCGLMALLAPGVPPLVGDLRYVAENTIVLASCGGASVYYAAYSNDPAAVLPRVRLSPDPSGSAAGAVVSFNNLTSPVTVARLVRIGGEYLMQLGRGVAVEMDDRFRSRLNEGKVWPHMMIQIGVPQPALMSAVGSHQYCVMPGDLSAEIEAACEAAGIRVLHIDSADELASFRPYPA